MKKHKAILHQARLHECSSLCCCCFSIFSWWRCFFDNNCSGLLACEMWMLTCKVSMNHFSKCQFMMLFITMYTQHKSRHGVRPLPSLVQPCKWGMIFSSGLGQQKRSEFSDRPCKREISFLMGQKKREDNIAGQSGPTKQRQSF